MTICTSRAASRGPFIASAATERTRLWQVTWASRAVCGASSSSRRTRPRTASTRIRTAPARPVARDSFRMQLFRRKSLDALVSDTGHPQTQLKRALGWVQLTSLGIGAIIGAGIFSTVGSAAAGGSSHLGAGPALVLSFVLVAIACAFSAFCYAEFAAMVPLSGSAYTYAY